MLELLTTLLMLVFLQAVLGFDNLLYISLESKKAPIESQSKVRRNGILIAIVLRIVLLFVLMSVIQFFQDPFFGINFGEMVATEKHGEISEVHGVIDSHFNVHSLIVLFGGAFILYTAIKEIWHMISQESLTDKPDNNDSTSQKTATAVIVSIVIMNLVFSFDSILAAIGLTKEITDETVGFMDGYTAKMVVMGIAIILSGLLMVLLADKVSNFLKKNRMYEVLGLFILLIVGIMLIAEGGHLAHLYILGNPIVPMNNTTFYFIIFILIIVDLVQTRYQKKITALEDLEEEKEIDIP